MLRSADVMGFSTEPSIDVDDPLQLPGAVMPQQTTSMAQRENKSKSVVTFETQGQYEIHLSDVPSIECSPEVSDAGVNGPVISLRDLALRRARAGRPSSDSDVLSELSREDGLNEEPMTSEQQQQQLAEIRARTMFDLTEDIDASSTSTGRRQLLFLTNAQADLISKTPGNLQRMLDALEVPKPKLVINLLTSQGLSIYCRHLPNTLSDEDVGLRPDLGGPFTSVREERELVSRLDTFMVDVILPLAAATNAIVICSARPQICMLSASLTRMLSIHRSKWGNTLPFTVLSASCEVKEMYCNPDPHSVWRGIKRNSKNWRMRDRKIQELVLAKYKNNVPVYDNDIDPNGVLFLIVDTIDVRRNVISDRRSYNKLVNELVRHLASTLPSLTLKTGHGDKPVLDRQKLHVSSLGVSTELMLSGSPMLFLDVRERDVIIADDRQTLIRNAIEQYEKEAGRLLEHGLCETFDAMSIAYFHEALFGDGVLGTRERSAGERSKDVSSALPTPLVQHEESNRRSASSSNAASPGFSVGVGIENNPLAQRAVPLYLAIERAEHGRSVYDDQRALPRASDAEVVHVCNYLADKFFEDAWKSGSVAFVDGFEDYKGLEKAGHGYESCFEPNIVAFLANIRTLFGCANFHSVNVNDKERAQHLVSELVKLDRLPKETSLPGLLLLKQAWCEFDVTMHLAQRYKVIGKTLFLFEIFLAWAVIVMAILRDEVEDDSDESDMLKHSLFGLSVLASIIISIDGLINAKTRWRQLRSCACGLDSLLWCYRARMGPFAQVVGDTQKPERALLESLNNWRDELVSAADLQTTALERRYADEVYKHHQFGNGIKVVLLPQSDDFHSPVKPETYIDLRLQPMIKFYQERIPVYTRRSAFLKGMLLLLSGAASTLAYLDMASKVILVTAAGGALTSWSEFSDISRKIERYTRAIRSLKKLQAFWDVLSDVEKAGIDNISLLISSAEAIIADERSAWQSTANRLAHGHDMAGASQKGEKSQQTKAGQRTDNGSKSEAKPLVTA